MYIIQSKLCGDILSAGHLQWLRQRHNIAQHSIRTVSLLALILQEVLRLRYTVHTVVVMERLAQVTTISLGRGSLSSISTTSDAFG